jgi:hypothetical protein
VTTGGAAGIFGVRNGAAAVIKNCAVSRTVQPKLHVLERKFSSRNLIIFISILILVLTCRF